MITDIDARRRLTAAAEAGPQPSAATLTEAFAAVRGPAAFAALAIAVAALPFLALGTLATAFTRPLVLSYLLAVLASMLVAFTLTPTLAVLLLRGRAGRPGWFARWVKRGTGRLLASSAATPGQGRRSRSAMRAVGSARWFAQPGVLKRH